MINNNIQILDCTLRDGGYCNHWEFGKNNIFKIIKGLEKARIDVIECGFLTNKIKYRDDISKFRTVHDIKNIIPKKKNETSYVCMMNFGEYDLDELPECDGTSIDGIRIAFHKKDRVEALELCENIKEKGYEVYVQAMVSMSYSDEEFLELIRNVNKINPKAFYIVDSFGSMKSVDLVHMFELVETNLDVNISIGFHCHNNMQLAYSNAQDFVSFPTKHNLIVDMSVMGMGRGAGNLNTELYVGYLNENSNKKYVLQPLLNLIDEVINGFYYKNYWGYSLPNYLSAKYNAHPNYASYLVNKNTLTVSNIDEILSVIDSTKKVEFDKYYIEEIYLQYMDREHMHETNSEKLSQIIQGKTILVIGPGRTVETEKNKITKFSMEHPEILKISVNFRYTYLDTDYVFVSNLRRFEKIELDERKKMITTSNIPTKESLLQVNYFDLRNDIVGVKDNAGMMLINLLCKFGAEKIVLAGIDGYAYEAAMNYAKDDLALVTQKNVLDEMNRGMEMLLRRYSEMVDIEFLTESRFAGKREK